MSDPTLVNHHSCSSIVLVSLTRFRRLLPILYFREREPFVVRQSVQCHDAECFHANDETRRSLLEYSADQVGVAHEQQSTGWDLISNSIFNSLCLKANLFVLRLLVSFCMSNRLFTVTGNNSIGSIVFVGQLVIASLLFSSLFSPSCRSRCHCHCSFHLQIA